ncbi:sulfite exporter TauE/SafE family protein [Vibrio renipiscarius]|uniref:sulfite exporter TauE/SafE family protein n=1 Tax=Vibrio renipiscarius TaxID=1461322 RepID=UPI00354E4877
MDEWMLFFAGVMGGVINSIAGGGSLITFPALMLTGIPAISANATNTFASSAGYLAGAYGFRHDFAHQPKVVCATILFSLLGGAIGAALLLSISEQLFSQAIPWLLLFATLLFVFGERISAWLQGKHSVQWLLPLLLVSVSAYGGFFNAGLGLVVLSYLVLAGYQDINQMNGLKLVVSSCVSLSAIAVFWYQGAIAWLPGAVVLMGSLLGGYVAARVSRKIKAQYIKNFVILSSAVMTLYFFIDIYLRPI